MLPVIGTWSINLGYTNDFSRDVRLIFRDDGTGTINSPGEEIAFNWESPTSTTLVLIIFGNRLGPFNLTFNRQNLPLGEFLVMESSGGLIPFDLRKFSKVD